MNPTIYVHPPCPVRGATGTYSDDVCVCGFLIHEVALIAAAGGDRDQVIRDASARYLAYISRTIHVLENPATRIAENRVPTTD